MNGSDVSVLMATYNRCGFIAEALTSLLKQSLPPAEVIVVDDGSTDDTVRIVSGFGSRVRYFRQDNRGKAAAINVALRQAKSTWVWIFDDDDIALPGALEAHCRELAQHPNVNFSYSLHGDLLPIGEGWAEHVPSGMSLPNAAELMFGLLTGAWIAYMQAMLVRRTVFLDLNGFREDFFRVEDEEFVLRLAGKYVGVPVAQVTFLLRRHPGDRGPGAQRFGAGDRTSVDRMYLQRVYRKAYASEPLTRYCPPGIAGPVDGDCGVDSLVVRMAVMMRVGIWDRASEDWMRIGLIDERIGAAALDVVSRVASGLAQSDWRDMFGTSGVFASSRTSGYGSGDAREVTLALLRGVYWGWRRELRAFDLRSTSRLLFVLGKLWLVWWRQRGSGSWRIFS